MTMCVIIWDDVYAALSYYHDHRQEIEDQFEREADTVRDLKGRYASKLEVQAE